MPHIVASGLISAIVGLYFRSFACACASFLAGVLIDLDHLFDYIRNCGKLTSLKKFYEACDLIKFKKIYLVLHSYELIAALWLTVWAFSLSDIWKALAIGMTQHLILDQIANPLKRGGYFFTYRAVNGFRTESIINSRKKE